MVMKMMMIKMMMDDGSDDSDTDGDDDNDTDGADDDDTYGVDDVENTD